MAGGRERHHYAIMPQDSHVGLFFFFPKLGKENGNGKGEGKTEASSKGLSTCVQRRAVT